jgi:hypothetical protein
MWRFIAAVHELMALLTPQGHFSAYSRQETLEGLPSPYPEWRGTMVLIVNEILVRLAKP